MRLLLKSVTLVSNYVIKVNSIQLRNFTKALTQDHVIKPETLTGRIFLYLNIDTEQSLNRPTPTSKLLQNVRQNRGHLHKLKTQEIVDISSSLVKENVPPNELVLLFKELDIEYTIRLVELKPQDILKLLNLYVYVTRSRINDYKFYHNSLKILSQSLLSLNKKELLQFIFYIGFMKKTLESQTMLRQCLRSMDKNFIDSLTSEELFIICNSTFRTSTKIINQPILTKIRSYINDNLSMLEDCALFATFVKTLRHNRFQDENLLSTISCAVIFNKTFPKYPFPAMCHIMALFADYFYYDSNLLKVFIEQGLKQLNESYFTCKGISFLEQLRAKDIKRFLWILSMYSDLKLVNQSSLKDIVVPKIVQRVEGKEFENDTTSLIDIILFLWMLNYRAYELVPYLFNKKNAQFLRDTSKSNLRLKLLLQAISIEDPDLAKKLPVKAPPKFKHDYSDYFQMRKRPLFERLLHNLEEIKNDIKLTKFELTYEVTHINIVGITGYSSEGRKAVYIEVLDEYNRIRNVDYDVPVGLMALKLRLLDHFDEGVLVVSEKEADEMTDKELQEYLLDEIKLIC